MKKVPILYVDDEKQNCVVFKATYRGLYDITTCTSAPEALHLIKEHKYSLIISDHKMPIMTGVELFEQSLNLSPASIRILVTGHGDVDTIVDAVNKGYIYQFVSKPWDANELKLVMENGLNKFTLEHENSELFNQIKLYSEDLEELLKKKIHDLKETNTLLNNEVRAHEVTIERLEKAVNKSEEAHEAKNSFLANMSHELRTPMHGILSFAQLGISKARTAPIEKLVAYFDHINESGNRLLTLLNNILDLAKLESSSIDYYFNPNSIQLEIDNSVVEYQALLDSSNIKVEVINRLQTQRLTFDQIRIGQVLRNLILNAIKFSPAETTISIIVDEDELVTDYVKQAAIKCSILDHGVGIPESELENVFDKFIQSSKTNNGSGGTGLGLTISKEIIQAHSGKLWATNRDEGTGAKFSFIIPREQLSQHH